MLWKSKKLTILVLLAFLGGFAWLGSINDYQWVKSGYNGQLEAKEGVFVGGDKNVKKDDWSQKGIKQYEPTHQQLVWIYALEWYESRGDNSAINPKDRDGTASFYAFQWKPETFKYYAIRYQLLPDNLEKEDYLNWMSDYDLQFEIIKRMVGERDKINWYKEFPVTIKKIGLPPKSN